MVVPAVVSQAPAADKIAQPVVPAVVAQAAVGDDMAQPVVAANGGLH